MEKKMDECLILLSKRGRAVVIIVVTLGPSASGRGAEALKRCGVLSVVEYEVLLQGLVVLCSGLHSIVMLLHSIVMLLYSTSAVQCILFPILVLYTRAQYGN